MIREFIRSWRTPASRTARRLGYLYESIAMEERFRRRRKSWRSHIDHCHKVILDEVTRSGSRSILILGSGPLNEIPMARLVETLDQVILVDIVHPLKVRRDWSRHPNVRLEELDLTGVGEALLGYQGGELPSPHPPSLPNADFILSANCLSQLPLKPRQHLENKTPPETLDRFCEEISKAHIEQIASLQKPHLIISDFETDLLDGSGALIERSRPFFDRSRLQLLNSWPWSVAPKGELARRHSLLMKVGAFHASVW
jgi:hypothetical protein